MTQSVLCVGRLYCDLVFAGTPRLPTPGTEVFATGLSLHAGGGAFNTGATLASLGLDASLLAHLPAPPFEDIVRRDLDAFRLNALPCRPAPLGVDAQVTVALPVSGDRAFVTRADGPALPDLAGVNWTAFQHLHIGELRTLQEHPDLLDHARGHGLSISLDCGWQDDFSVTAAALIAAVDVFFPNEIEANALSIAGIAPDCAPLTVVKCGADGARVTQACGTLLQVSGHAVSVADPTGAGDAFNGGFLSKWLAGADLKSCLEAGNRAGAAAVQTLGGAVSAP